MRKEKDDRIIRIQSHSSMVISSIEKPILTTAALIPLKKSLSNRRAHHSELPAKLQLEVSLSFPSSIPGPPIPPGLPTTPLPFPVPEYNTDCDPRPTRPLAAAGAEADASYSPPDILIKSRSDSSLPVSKSESLVVTLDSRAAVSKRCISVDVDVDTTDSVTV